MSSDDRTGSPSDLVVVATFAMPGEAEVAASMLESEGIGAFIDKPFVSGIRPDWLFGISRPGKGVRLLVSTEDAEVARALLEGIESASDEEG